MICAKLHFTKLALKFHENNLHFQIVETKMLSEIHTKRNYINGFLIDFQIRRQCVIKLLSFLIGIIGTQTSQHHKKQKQTQHNKYFGNLFRLMYPSY